MKKIIFSLFILLGYLPILAQIEITGKVIDAHSDNPVIGAVIEIPELNRATMTDTAGIFHIQIPRTQVKAQITYLGYKTQTLLLSPDNLHPVVKLEPSYTEIEGIIVTAGEFSDAHTNAIKVQSIKSRDFLPDASNLKFLTAIPGVEIISKGNAIAQPVIRGLSGTNILVLKNGFRLENFQFSQNHPFLVGDEGTSKVEIIKGPASLLYGSDAIGGVINFLWEKPAPINKILIDYNLDYFSNGYGVKENFGVKASNEKVMWGLRGIINTQSDFYDGSGKQVLNSRFNIYNTKAFAIVNTKNSVHKFFIEGAKYKLGLPIAPAFAYIKDNSNVNTAFYQDLTDLFAANKNQFFLGQNTKIYVNLSYENNSRGIKIHKDNPPAIHMIQQTINYEMKMAKKLDNIIMLTGLQGYSITNNNDTAAPGKIIPDFYKNSYAAFSLIKLQVDEKFNFQTGLRYEFSQVKIPRQQYYDLFGRDTALKYNNLSASAGATFEPTQYLHIRFNTATGFRMPNMAELTQYGVHAYRFEQGNLHLQPQRSWETDLSVHFHTSKVMIDLCSFYNKIDHYIYLSPTNEFTTDSMRIYRYMQSNALIYGQEAGIDYHPVKNIEIKSTYSYIIGRQADTSYLPLMPQNKIHLWLTYMNKIKNSQWRLTVKYTHAFAQNRIAPTEQPSPTYNLWNVYLQTVIPTTHFRWHITIGYENIFNEKYSDHLSTLKEAGFYDMGRSFIFKLSIPIEQNY